MKLILMSILFIITMLGCEYEVKHKINISENQYNNMRVLIKDNLEYFIKEDPENYMDIPECAQLFEVDSLINTLIWQSSKDVFDTSKVNELLKKTNRISKSIDTRNIKKFFFKNRSCIDKNSIIQELLLTEYILSNELIKKYNYYLVRMPLSKIEVLPKSNPISLGEIYEADIILSCANPNKKFVITIDNDTLDYENEMPIYSFKPSKKGVIVKKGTFSIYREESGDYWTRPFQFKVEIK